MTEFNAIEDVAKSIKRQLDTSTSKKKILALYAFNSTGKTRLTNILSESESEDEVDNRQIKILCYNAFLEDIFKWDNESYILTFDTSSWIIQLIVEQGLEGAIIDNFKDIINLKIEPSFDFTKGEVTFNIVSGDDRSTTNIKISKGEESALIWSVFYVVLKTAIDALSTDEAERTTAIFNNLKYIIIDDPVSSIDDARIITIAIKLIETIQSCQNNAIKFFITTHHALFYNVIVNNFNKNARDRKCSFKSYSLLKDNYIFRLSEKGDSPFSYHLSVKEIIQKAIESDSLEKYHFNLFRNILEKTANFLGYNHWTDCVAKDNRQKFIKLLNLYSHGKLSDLESRELSGDDKNLFKETFDNFMTHFKWS